MQHAHSGHDHVHDDACGHVAIRHEGHIDYLHDGHLHREHDGHFDECLIGVDARNPAACTPAHSCPGHEAVHVHGEACGHETVPHGDHTDYLVCIIPMGRTATIMGRLSSPRPGLRRGRPASG